MLTNTLEPDGDDGQPGKKDNNDTEVINKPEEVQQSNDAKIDQDYEGYPHHPANEDELDAEN